MRSRITPHSQPLQPRKQSLFLHADGLDGEISTDAATAFAPYQPEINLGRNFRLVIDPAFLLGSGEDVRKTKFAEEYRTVLKAIDEGQNLDAICARTIRHLKEIFLYDGGSRELEKEYDELRGYISFTTQLRPESQQKELAEKKQFCKKLIEGAYFAAHTEFGDLKPDIATQHSIFHAKVIANACLGGAISSVELLSSSQDAAWPQFVESLTLANQDVVRIALQQHLVPFFGFLSGLKSSDQYQRNPAYELMMGDLERVLKSIIACDARVLIPSISQQYYDAVLRAERNVIEEVAQGQMAEHEGLEKSEIKRRIAEGDVGLAAKLAQLSASIKANLAEKHDQRDEEILAQYEQNIKKNTQALTGEILSDLANNVGNFSKKYQALFGVVKVLAKRQIIASRAVTSLDVSPDEVLQYFKSRNFQESKEVISAIRRDDEVSQGARNRAGQEVIKKFAINHGHLQNLIKKFQKKQETESLVIEARNSLLMTYLQQSEEHFLKLIFDSSHGEFLEIGDEELRKRVLESHVTKMLLEAENRDPNKPDYITQKEIDEESLDLVVKALAYAAKNKQIPLWLQKQIEEKAKKIEPEASGDAALILLAEMVIMNVSSKQLLSEVTYAVLPENPNLQDLLTNGASYAEIILFLRENPRAVIGNKFTVEGLLFNPQRQEIMYLLKSKTSLSRQVSVLLGRNENPYPVEMAEAIDNALILGDENFANDYFDLEHPSRSVNNAISVVRAIKFINSRNDLSKKSKGNIIQRMLLEITLSTEISPAESAISCIIRQQHYLQVAGYSNLTKFLSEVWRNLTPAQMKAQVSEISRSQISENIFDILVREGRAGQELLHKYRVTCYEREDFIRYHIGQAEHFAQLGHKEFKTFFDLLDDVDKKLVITMKGRKGSPLINLINENLPQYFEEFLREVFRLDNREGKKQTIDLIWKDRSLLFSIFQDPKYLKVVLDNLSLAQREEFLTREFPEGYVNKGNVSSLIYLSKLVDGESFALAWNSLAPEAKERLILKEKGSLEKTILMFQPQSFAVFLGALSEEFKERMLAKIQGEIGAILGTVVSFAPQNLKAFYQCFSPAIIEDAANQIATLGISKRVRNLTEDLAANDKMESLKVLFDEAPNPKIRKKFIEIRGNYGLTLPMYMAPRFPERIKTLFSIITPKEAVSLAEIKNEEGNNLLMFFAKEHPRDFPKFYDAMIPEHAAIFQVMIENLKTPSEKKIIEVLINRCASIADSASAGVEPAASCSKAEAAAAKGISGQRVAAGMS